MRLPATILQGILARAALTFLRIYLGAACVLSAWAHLQGGYPLHLPAFLSPASEDLTFLAGLIPWAQLLAGTLLILGLATRLAAAGVLLAEIDAMLLQSGGIWVLTSRAAAFAGIAIALAIGAAGRTFGFDSLLAKRWPRSPFW